MARRDLLLQSSKNGSGYPGTKTVLTTASATTLLSGEPVLRVLGDPTCTPMQTNSPVVAPTFLEGIASTDSTHTASVAGSCQVVPINEQDVWLISPKTASDIDTQAKYDALVGNRVLIDLSGGVYTCLTSDSSANGCVIQPLNIASVPGKVAIRFRAGVSCTI